MPLPRLIDASHSHCGPTADLFLICLLFFGLLASTAFNM